MDDGPHLVYCPEADFDQDEFVSSIEKCLARLGRCLVAVSEGIHDSSGKLFMQVTIHALSPAEKLLPPPPPPPLALSLCARVSLPHTHDARRPSLGMCTYRGSWRTDLRRVIRQQDCRHEGLARQHLAGRYGGAR